MLPLINPTETRYVLGVNLIDETHQEFISLINQIAAADNKTTFYKLFLELAEHTEAHFDTENQLMEQTGFPAIREHMDEHQRVLGELHRLKKKVLSGSVVMAQIYLTEHIPQWFELHAATMDSALAAHIKSVQQCSA